MPLPEGKTVWPPADVKPYIDAATKAGAWWTGDRATLQDTAGQTGDVNRRAFWQRRKPGDATKATATIHAPLAADIASVSSDLLFGDPVGLTVDNAAAQEQLEHIEDVLGLENTFAESAEVAAATGGVYLRAAWDENVADHALLQTYRQTQAVPDFRYGRLVAVTLWETVYTSGSEVWRHLERHEPGRILHGLYKGDRNQLGAAAPLGDHPATADLDTEVILTGRLAGRLLVQYVPNVLPNRSGLKPIGRADWDGSDDLLDALDETWTSVMRDVRLGQAHVFVPQTWLTSLGNRPGSQAKLDLDQEIFTAVNPADDQTWDKLETFQADIRVQDHLKLLMGITERIVSAAGYSPQTFGLQIDGNAQSGTALRIRQGKTDKTTGKKQRYWTPGIADTMRTLLDIGAETFHRPAAEGPVKVTWPEVERDPSEQATWVSALRTAQAMSIENAVKTVQPDLDNVEMGEEVARIKAESAIADPYPMV